MCGCEGEIPDRVDVKDFTEETYTVMDIITQDRIGGGRS